MIIPYLEIGKGVDTNVSSPLLRTQEIENSTSHEDDESPDVKSHKMIRPRRRSTEDKPNNSSIEEALLARI